MARRDTTEATEQRRSESEEEFVFFHRRRRIQIHLSLCCFLGLCSRDISGLVVSGGAVKRRVSLLLENKSVI